MTGQSGLLTGVRRAVPRPAPALRSLGWVRGLLPAEEGTAWWAEVTSCVAETSDPGERRRYLRSYRQAIPQLVWTSWTSEVRSAKPALAGADYRNVKWKGTDVTFVNTEDKFGIKIQSARAPRTLEQSFSMIAGSIYVVGGIIGFFVTGFGSITEVTNHSLFGIFMLNPFHNIVHIALGGLWLLAAFALTPAGTEGMNVAIGGTYALATVLGFFGYFSLLSIPAGATGDNFLHLVTALVTFVFGCGLLRAMGGAQAATA